MKAIYDARTDTLRLLLSTTPVEESDEARPGIILDYDRDGRLVGIEILDASTRTDNPRAFEYAIAG